MLACTKKSILLLALWVSSQGYLLAQQFDAGAFFGLTTSQVDGDNITGYDMPGANLGVFTSRSILKQSEIMLELAWVQKGARVPPKDSTNFGNFYKLKLNYLEIPLIYRYYWKDLSFELGLAVDILVSYKEEDIGGSFNNGVPFNTTSLTGIAGVRWDFSEKWAIVFRTNNSLTAIRDGRTRADKPQQVVPGRYVQRNVSLSFALVYLFKPED